MFFYFYKIIFEPRDFNKLIIVLISFTFGKFLIITFFSNNKVAASIGKDAFFEPEILTCPLSLQGPLI